MTRAQSMVYREAIADLHYLVHSTINNTAQEDSELYQMHIDNQTLRRRNFLSSTYPIVTDEDWHISEESALKLYNDTTKKIDITFSVCTLNSNGVESACIC